MIREHRELEKIRCDDVRSRDDELAHHLHHTVADVTAAVVTHDRVAQVASCSFPGADLLDGVNDDRSARLGEVSRQNRVTPSEETVVPQRPQYGTKILGVHRKRPHVRVPVVVAEHCRGKRDDLDSIALQREHGCAVADMPAAHLALGRQNCGCGDGGLGDGCHATIMARVFHNDLIATLRGRCGHENHDFHGGGQSSMDPHLMSWCRQVGVVGCLGRDGCS